MNDSSAVPSPRSAGRSKRKNGLTRLSASKVHGTVGAPAAQKLDSREMLPADLAKLLATKQVLPVDIREPVAFGRYRIPGAINVPASEAEARVEELEAVDGRERVLYARSGEEAKALSDKFAAAGFDVAFLVGGFLHWEADGFEVERG